MPTEKTNNPRRRIKVHVEKIPEYQVRKLTEPFNRILSDFCSQPGYEERKQAWLDGGARERFNL